MFLEKSVQNMNFRLRLT